MKLLFWHLYAPLFLFTAAFQRYPARRPRGNLLELAAGSDRTAPFVNPVNPCMSLQDSFASGICLRLLSILRMCISMCHSRTHLDNNFNDIYIALSLHLAVDRYIHQVTESYRIHYRHSIATHNELAAAADALAATSTDCRTA
jgi:hypothetical protein